MAKSRSFSIFLLKQEFNESNSLKDDHTLAPVTNAQKLPSGASLYIMDTNPSEPWWKDYWGIQQPLKQVLKGSIVFLPVKKRFFALTFGHTWHQLKSESYEYDFGLKTALNALDPDKLKSTDILNPETAKRSRIQSATMDNLTFFDFNRDESIVKKLTGKVKKEYEDILSHITGTSSLKISTTFDASSILSVCKKLLDMYGKNDYKKHFPDLQNIVPVKDPTLISSLNKKFIESLNSTSSDTILTIPELVEYNDSFYIKYSGEGRTKLQFDDVKLEDYKTYLQEKKEENFEFDIRMLKKHELNLVDSEGKSKKSYSIYKCLLFDCDLNGSFYHLCEGEWYSIEKNYIEKLQKSLDPLFVEDDFFPAFKHPCEAEYNKAIASTSPEYICLDKKNIAPQGQSQIEPCDVYHVKEGKARLVHIKISTRSSTLSHLFNQGLNSVEALRQEEESKTKLKNLLKESPEVDHSALCAPIDQGAYEIVYGIITEKDSSKKSSALPFFSRISLARTSRTLKTMNIPYSVVLIESKNAIEKSNTRASSKCKS